MPTPRRIRLMSGATWAEGRLINEVDGWLGAGLAWIRGAEMVRLGRRRPDSSGAPKLPKTAPATPPATPMMRPSIMNCDRMCRLVKPKALSMPISFVLSLTA